tara:strand:- start:892 stop:3753 length:2862 start_codon:yes stop_codon:yes gene_type:complete
MPSRKRKEIIEPYEVDPTEIPNESFLGNAIQYLERGAWTARSLLMGDTEQAGQHFGALFGGEAPELGPEFDDVLRHHGIATPTEGTPLSFAVNVLGGIVTDPLTYLTLGGGGLAKGALVGASRDLATGSLSHALKRGVMSPKFAAKKAANPGLKDTKIAEEIFKDTLQDTDYFKGLSNTSQTNILSKFNSEDWQSLDKDVWGSVIDSLQKTGDIEKTGMALRLDVPFTGIGMDVPGTRALGQAAHKLIPFKDILDASKRGFVSKFLDKTETSLRHIPQGLKYAANDYLQKSRLEENMIGVHVVREFGPKGNLTWHSTKNPTFSHDLSRVGASDISEYRRKLNNAVADEGGTGAARVKWELLERAEVEDVRPLDSEKYLSLPEIIYSRLVRKNREHWRGEFKEFAKKVDTNKTDLTEKDLVRYAEDIFEDIRPNKTLFSKVISGGRFTIKYAKPKPDEQGTYKKLPLPLRPLAFALFPGMKLHKTKTGTDIVYPGFNNVWKGLVTSNILNIPYHVRNAVGSVFMGALNPDIGWSGLTAAFRMVPGISKSGKDMRLIHKALHADQNIASDAIEEISKLNRQGKKFAGMPIEEFLKIARGALGGRVSHSAMDIVSETGEAFDLLNRKGQNIAHKVMFQAGENMANYVENFMRLTALEKLLKKGYEPTRALMDVQKQFVDYTLVSHWEKSLRDMIPFIKYQLGSLNWTKQALSRPRQVAWVGDIQQDQDMLLDSQKDPQSGETPSAIGIGNLRYDIGSGGLSTLEALESTGLPSLLKGNLIEAAASPTKLLEDIHPIYRGALEYAFEKDLYTKQSFFADRRAPKWMPDWFVTKLTRQEGITVREIDPLARSLMYDLSPFNRQLRMLDKLIEGKYLQPIFGVKEIEDMKKRADRITLKNINKLLRKKLKDGEVKEFLQYSSAYDKENTPYELKQIFKARRELFKKFKQESLEEKREKR